MSARHDYETAAVREIERWPGVAVRFEKTAKHRRAVFSVAGQSRFVVYPTSPSDSRRGALAFLTDVRTTLRSMGAVQDMPQERGARAHRHGPSRTRGELTAPAISDPRPDGFAALRDLQARYGRLIPPSAPEAEIDADPRPAPLWARLMAKMGFAP